MSAPHNGCDDLEYHTHVGCCCKGGNRDDDAVFPHHRVRTDESPDFQRGRDQLLLARRHVVAGGAGIVADDVRDVVAGIAGIVGIGPGGGDDDDGIVAKAETVVAVVPHAHTVE